MSLPRPSPDAQLLAPDAPAPEGARVWVYEGWLEQFAGAQARFHYLQRIVWPHDPEWETVRELGVWMVERLSVNGHLLVGLRARPEGATEGEERLIRPE